MQHVMIDLYGCRPELLANDALLHQVLDQYPDRIGMEKVSPVFLKDIKTSNLLDDGLSGFVIIATSHISLHSWPCYGMVNIDVFSCEPFSPDEAVRFALQMFGAKDVELHVIERAMRSPRQATNRANREAFSGDPEHQRAASSSDAQRGRER